MHSAISVALILLFTILLISLIGKKRHSQDREYDEREQQVRGEAYRNAFTAILLFVCFHVLALVFLGHPPMADGVSSLFSFFLGVAVFAVYCIRHNAFKTIRTDKGFRSYSILLGIVVAINTWTGILSARAGNLIEDGILQTPITSFACALCFLAVLITMFLQRAKNRQEEAA